MSRIQPHANVGERATNAAPPMTKEMSRKEKTNSILTEVLPMAVSLGLELGGAGGAKSAGRPGKKTRGKIGAKGADAATKGGSKMGDVSGATSALGMAGGWTSVAGGVMGAVDIAMNWGRSTPSKGAASGSAVGAMIGTFIAPGIGTAIGAALGAIGGGLLGSVKAGKHADQKLRDQVRALLVDKGVLDQNYTIGLADGSRFDIGYDGGPKKQLGGRRPYETDPANPHTKYAISWLNPVVAFLSQGHQKVQTDFVGYLANAAVSNAKSISDVKANVNTIMKQFGLSDAKLVKGITQAAEAGELPAEEAKAWLNGVRERTSAEFTGDRTEAVRDVEQTQDLEPLDTEQVEVEATDDEFETTEVD